LNPQTEAEDTQNASSHVTEPAASITQHTTQHRPETSKPSLVQPKVQARLQAKLRAIAASEHRSNREKSSTSINVTTNSSKPESKADTALPSPPATFKNGSSPSKVDSFASFIQESWSGGRNASKGDNHDIEVDEPLRSGVKTPIVFFSDAISISPETPKAISDKITTIDEESIRINEDANKDQRYINLSKISEERSHKETPQQSPVREEEIKTIEPVADRPNTPENPPKAEDEGQSTIKAGKAQLQQYLAGVAQEVPSPPEDDVAEEEGVKEDTIKRGRPRHSTSTGGGKSRTTDSPSRQPQSPLQNRSQINHPNKRGGFASRVSRRHLVIANGYWDNPRNDRRQPRRVPAAHRRKDSENESCDNESIEADNKGDTQKPSTSKTLNRLFQDQRELNRARSSEWWPKIPKHKFDREVEEESGAYNDGGWGEYTAEQERRMQEPNGGNQCHANTESDSEDSSSLGNSKDPDRTSPRDVLEKKKSRQEQKLQAQNTSTNKRATSTGSQNPYATPTRSVKADGVLIDELTPSPPEDTTSTRERRSVSVSNASETLNSSKTHDQATASTSGSIVFPNDKRVWRLLDKARKDDKFIEVWVAAQPPHKKVNQKFLRLTENNDKSIADFLWREYDTIEGHSLDVFWTQHRKEPPPPDDEEDFSFRPWWTCYKTPKSMFLEPYMVPIADLDPRDNFYDKAMLEESLEERMKNFAKELRENQAYDKQQTRRLAIEHKMPEARPRKQAPVISIYLRLARPKDFKQMVLIYNHNVKIGWGVIDLQTISVEEMNTRFEELQSKMLPIIVAVKQLANPKLGPKGKPIQSLAAQGEEDIVGYGIVDGYGSADSVFHTTAEIDIQVREQYQGSGVGNALLDYLLFTVDKDHTRQTKVEFTDKGRFSTQASTEPFRAVVANIIYAPKSPHRDIVRYRWLRKWFETFGFDKSGELHEIAQRQKIWYVLLSSVS
jgi:L-amino acid N-acyltransferase YncA